EGNAPFLEALEFELRFVELHARDRAAWGERLVAGDTPCDDRDLLIELALALAHIGHVDGLHRRCHVGQHVARLDPRAKPPEAAGRCPGTAAGRRPEQPPRLWSWGGPARA